MEGDIGPVCVTGGTGFIGSISYEFGFSGGILANGNQVW
jgi:hypothetical protein